MATLILLHILSRLALERVKSRRMWGSWLLRSKCLFFVNAHYFTRMYYVSCFSLNCSQN